MNKNYKLTDEELEILQSVNSGEFKELDDDKMIEELKIASKNTLHEKEFISLHLKKPVINRLKGKADKLGISYKTMLGIVVNKFANDEINVHL